ncbi:MAG: hypothetical protein ABII82_02630 [Verrucomicrobiota bacterium]
MGRHQDRDADIRLDGATFVAAESSGTSIDAADLPKDDVQAISPEVTWIGLDRGMPTPPVSPPRPSPP